MAEWMFWSWKTLSVILTFTLIPFIIGLIVNYTTWLGTRQRVEITLKLDGWITIGTLRESGLEKLELTHKGKSVKNAMKISWRIINTGSKGISEFETLPALVYPKALDIDIAKAIISETSPLLKVEEDLLINSEDRSIKVSDMGIFNKGDFIRIDVYILDIPESIALKGYLKDWDLVVKAVDLRVKKNIVFELTPEEEENRIFWQKFFSSPP